MPYLLVIPATSPIPRIPACSSRVPLYVSSRSCYSTVLQRVQGSSLLGTLTTTSMYDVDDAYIQYNTPIMTSPLYSQSRNQRQLSSSSPCPIPSHPNRAVFEHCPSWPRHISASEPQYCGSIPVPNVNDIITVPWRFGGHRGRSRGGDCGGWVWGRTLQLLMDFWTLDLSEFNYCRWISGSRASV